MALEASFELRSLAVECIIAGQDTPKTDKRAHDGHVDLNGSLAAAWKDMAAKGVKRIQSTDLA